MAELPEVTISYDDGRVFSVRPRQSDGARAERILRQPFQASWSFMFVTTWLAVRRLKIDETSDLDEFMDSVTLDWE